MPEIRKVTSVDNDQVNLAYVGGKKIDTSDVEVTPAAGGQRILDRKLMYADIAGRLIDGSTGSATINDPFPAVTDLFFDKDKDRLLDASEVYAHASLPYVYNTLRPYFGLAVTPVADTYTYDPNTDNYVGELPGRYSTSSDDIVVEYLDGTPYDGSFHVMVERVPTVGVVGNRVNPDPGQDAQVDPVPQDEFSGMTAHRVWVHLDRDDADIQVRFIAGDVVDVNGLWRPSNIDSNRIEKVAARPLYRYESLDTVTDPRNAHKRIVASRPSADGYELFVPGAAIVDTRQPDFFFWRLRATFERSKPTYSIEKDKIRVGVIGTAPEGLKAWLSGTTQDPSLKHKVTFENPLPKGSSTWEANINFSKPYQEVITDMLKYDVLLVIGDTHRWSSFKSYYCGYMFRGGTLVFDVTGARAPVFTDSSTDPIGFSYGDMKNSNLFFDELEPMAQRIKEASIGYDISDTEIDYMTFGRANGLPRYYPVYRTVRTHSASTLYTVVLSPNSKPAYAIRVGGTTKITDFTNVGPLWRFNGTAGKQYVVHYTSDSGRIVNTNDSAKTSSLQSLDYGLGRMFVSGMGLFRLRDNRAEQLATNIMLSAGREDVGQQSGSVTTKFEITTPWKRDWVLGIDEHGRSVITDEEAKQYGFFSMLDTDTGQMIPKRALSASSVRELVSGHVSTDPQLKDIVLPSDNVTYSLELSGASGFVEGAGQVSASDNPVVWTTRVTNNFVVPDGWRMGRFEKDESSTSPVVVDAARPFTAGVIAKFDGPRTLNIKFNADLKFLYNDMVVKRIEKEVDSDSGLIDRITTWSDIEWHAVKGGDPTSNANLRSWGYVTGKKWYPWDGQTMLLSTHRGSTGDDVRYVQNALNKIHAIGRDSASGAKNPHLPLKVDGVYGRKTESAVTWYQSHWHFTADGDVDAGTCGHILRNAKDRTNDKNLDARWAKYGSLWNIVDGSGNTCHGRRSWVNMNSSIKMVDAVHIFLKKNVTITDLKIKPILAGTKAGSQDLRFTKVGGALDKVFSWDVNGDGFSVADGATREMRLRNRDLDRLTVSFTQDKAFHKNSKMWGLTHLIFNGYVEQRVAVPTEKTITLPRSGQTIAINSDTPWVYEWTPDEVKAVGKYFVRYIDTEESLAKEILDSIEENCPGYSKDFEVVVTYTGAKVRIEIRHKDVNLPMATVTNASRTNNVVTLTLNSATIFGNAGAHVSDVGVFGITEDLSDANGFGKTITIVDGTHITFASVGPDVAQYNTGGNVGQMVLSSTWDGHILENQTMVVTSFTSQVEDLMDIVENKVLENWRVVLAPIILSGSGFAEAMFHDSDDEKLYSSMTINEFRDRGSSLHLAVVSKRYEFEDPDTIRGTVFPKLYAMRPYGIVTSGGYGTFSVGEVIGDGIDEVWGLEIGVGETDNNISVPSNLRPATSPLADLIRKTLGKTVKAHYEITGGPFDEADSTAPYIDIHETVDMIDEYTFRLNHRPVAYTEAGEPQISFKDGANNAVDIVSIDPDGTVTLAESVVGGTVDYTYIERSIIYRGWRDGTDISFFDLCPVRGHIITIDGVDTDVTSLLGQKLYVYVYPNYVEIGNQTLVLNDIHAGVNHTTDGAMFDKTSDLCDPYALLLCTVTMKRIDPSSVLVIDTRDGGGGIDAGLKREALKINTEVHGFYDIGHMDGDAYFPGGTVVVKLPSAWRTRWEALGQDVLKLAEKTLSKVVPAGKTVLILWDDGVTSVIHFYDTEDFESNDFE